MSNFDWRTGGEDGEGWDEPLDGGAERPSITLPPWLKRWGPWLGGVLILLVIVGLVLANLFDRQVEEVEDNTNNDLLATHQLLRQAIENEDYELLATLTDSDNNWRNLQTELLNVGLVLDRRPLGLELIPQQPLSIQLTPTITVSADLQTAVIVDQIPYQIITGERISETVWLEQSFHYERQGESWFWTAPPDDVDYWGKWNSTEYSDNLLLIYAERDKPFADYLGVRLDELIGRMCRDNTIDCPPDFYVEFRLERRPDSLRQLNESYFNVSLLSSQNIYHFDMPSPTVIGRPLQESDYDVLYQGYGSWLAAVMTVRYLNDNAIFESNPIDLTLANLGLEVPPQPLVPMPIPQPIEPPPIPFPEQDILLVCSGFTQQALLRFNPRDNEWLDELSRLELDDFIFDPQFQSFSGFGIAPLPDDSGVLAFNNLILEGGHQSIAYLLDDGEIEVWLEEDFYIDLFPANSQQQFDRNGRKWVVAEYIFTETEDGSRSTLIYYALDLTECQAGNCSLEHYEGIPHWSPDLNWALLIDSGTQSDLVLQNETTGETVELGQGYSPYWLDNETFIYIDFDEEQSQEEGPTLVSVVQATVSEPLSGTVLFDTRDISRFLDDGNPDTSLNINSIIAHPDHPDWFFMSVNTSPLLTPFEYYIMDFNAETGEFHILVDQPGESMNAPFRIIHDGRFLLVQSYSGFSSQSEYRLIPLDPAEKTAGPDVQNFSAFQSFRDDLSVDQRWLMIVESGSLRLIAPGYDYDQTVDYNIDFCYQAFWVDPIAP